MTLEKEEDGISSWYFVYRLPNWARRVVSLKSENIYFTFLRRRNQFWIHCLLSYLSNWVGRMMGSYCARNGQEKVVAELWNWISVNNHKSRSSTSNPSITRIRRRKISQQKWYIVLYGNRKQVNTSLEIINPRPIHRSIIIPIISLIHNILCVTLSVINCLLKITVKDKCCNRYTYSQETKY